MKMKLTSLLNLFVLTILLYSCKGAVDSKFDFLETDSQDSTPPVTVSISSYSPSTSTTVLTSNEIKTFVIALAETDTGVSYKFDLKRISTGIITTLQNGNNPYINLNSSTLSEGAYELIVTASNSTSNDTHVFNLRKNAPPSVPPTPLTFSPSLTGTILDCASSTQIFQSDISDNDSDPLTVTWKLDGVSTSSSLINNSTTVLAKATYSPSCTETGLRTIELVVNDGYESTTKTWTVSVINPLVVSINAYSPGADPVYIMSNGSQSFTVTATGKAPVSYQWKLDGTTIPSATDPFYTLSATSLAVGAHTLSVRVFDSTSEQTKTWNVIRNTPPTISNTIPSSSNLKINIATLINFSASFSDGNNDSMTVHWKLNNIVISSGHPNATITTTSTSSSLAFSPSAAILGQNKIDLVVDDGKETTTQTWYATVNYLSDICNNMGSGRICTLLGRPGLGSNINPLVETSKVRFQPSFITSYDGTSYFFSDPVNHVIWFYNKGSSPVTILGQTIGAGKLKTVVGLGVCGTGTNDVVYTDYPICTPRGLAWDNANGRLFFADEGNYRIGMIDSSGLVKRVAAGGSNNSTGHVDGSLATSHYCPTPRDITYDSNTHRLYVACYGTGKADDTFGTDSSSNASAASIKYFNVSDTSNYANFTGFTLIGATSGGLEKRKIVTGKIGATTAPDTSASTAMAQTPQFIRLDSDNQILYYTEVGNPTGTVAVNACQLMAVNLTGTAKTNYFFNSITLPAYSNVKVLGGTCGTANLNTSQLHSSAIFASSSWMPLELRKNGTTLEGFYIGSSDNHRVSFFNNTANSITVGNQTTLGYNGIQIWGNGTSGYEPNCTSLNSNCYINYPISLTQIGTKLYLGDYNNYRIRFVYTNVTNGSHSVEIGNDSHAGFAGNGGTSSENVQFNTPMELFVDNNTNRLVISDMNNNRIRSMNLDTGRVDQFIGNGYGNANTANADPSSVGMFAPRQVINYQNNFIYADAWQNSGTSTSVNCNLRIFNTTDSLLNVFGVSTTANAIQTIAGSFANGCGPFNTAATTGIDSNVRLRTPVSLTTNGTDIYFTNTGDHCILKLAQNGALSTFSGLCGTEGAANATGLAYNNTAIRYRTPGAIVVDPRSPYFEAGNLFILDQTKSSNSVIRYLNQSSSSVTIYNVTIPPGEIKTVFSDKTSYGASLAIYDPIICTSNGGNINHQSNGNSSNAANTITCFNRDNNGTSWYKFGRNPDNFNGRGNIQQDTEEEGIPADQASLAGPSGIAFDEDGNLYISERWSHTIRMIKKWW